MAQLGPNQTDRDCVRSGSNTDSDRGDSTRAGRGIKAARGATQGSSRYLKIAFAWTPTNGAGTELSKMSRQEETQRERENSARREEGLAFGAPGQSAKKKSHLHYKPSLLDYSQV
jgi:hypothetical protein